MVSRNLGWSENKRGTRSEGDLFAGTWKGNIVTPVGTMKVRFDIEEHEGVVGGVASNEFETVEMLEVKDSGNKLSWEQEVAKPMKLRLVFAVEVVGDEMEGTAKAGFLPASKLRAVRE